MNISRMLMLPALLVMLSLVGCGGGSDGEKSITSTVSGTVNKGIIINGVVNAYKIVDGLIERDVIATGKTDDTGNYSLTVENYSGPLLIVVSAGAESKMKCDSVAGCDTDNDGKSDADFGDLIEMPADLKLELMLPALVSGGEVMGSVNPLTHMAAAYAKSLGAGEAGIQSLSVQAAIDRVEALFGVENLTLNSLDITNDDAVSAAGIADINALKISYISAAIAKLAGDDFHGDMVAALDILTKSFTSKNGQLINNLSSYDGLDEDENEITLLEIVQASLATMESPDVADNPNLDPGIGNEFDAQNNAASGEAEGVVTKAVVTIDNDDLEAAKNIVQSVRTWAVQLETLGNKGQLFADEYEMTQQVSNLALNSVGEGLAYSTGAAAMAYVWSNHQDSPVTSSIAGKAITFNAGSEDEKTIDFTCDGEIVLNGLGGDYLANENKLYIWSDSEGSYVINVPTVPVSSGQSWSVKWYDDYDNLLETSDYSISSISEGSCDSDISIKLADYVEELDTSIGKLTTGSVVVEGLTVTVNGAIDGADVNLIYTMPALVGNSFTAAMQGSVSVANKVTISIGDESAAIISLNGTHELLDEFSEPPAFKNADLVLDVSLEQGSIDDSGIAVTDPVKFVGRIEAAAVSMPGKNWEDFELNPSNFKLSGEFSRIVSGQSFEASFDASMANASSFVHGAPPPIGHMRDDLASYRFSSNGNELIVTTEHRTTTYSFDLNTSDVSATDTYEWGGEYTSVVAENVESLASYLASETSSPLGQTNWWIWIECEGEYLAEWPASGFTQNSGMLPAKLQWSDQCDEDEAHWRDVQGELTLNAQFSNLPEATITANLDRTGYESAEGSVTFAYDNITITLSGNGDGVTKEYDLNLLVTDTSSGSPVRLTIYPDEIDELKGSVVVNGNMLGTISEMYGSDSLIINYIDGSFESVVF